MRIVTGNCEYRWWNREDKLKNYIFRTEDCFKNYNIILYLLYSQYIGPEVVGSNISNKNHYKKNGRKCHYYFELNFQNDAFLTNKSTAAALVPLVATAVPLGPCPRPWRGVVTALPTH